MLESRFFVPGGVLSEGVAFGVVHRGDIGHVLIIEFKSVGDVPKSGGLASLRSATVGGEPVRDLLPTLSGH